MAGEPPAPLYGFSQFYNGEVSPPPHNPLATESAAEEKLAEVTRELKPDLEIAANAKKRGGALVGGRH